MNEFWPEVERIFADAAAVPAGERDAWLRDRCQDRPDLASEVRALLDSSDRAGSFLAERESGTIGSRIAGFELTRLLGRGGMGAVYEAERTGDDFRQRVAIKLIHRAPASSGVLQRFRAERQILATLNHPYIVTLIDGGISEDGNAYLVMEYVDGVPVTRYCEDARLPLAARLRLCARLAAAVHHAHERDIVHRDLKPGNILVTPDGTPKILDFGIGKMLESSDGGREATAPGVAAGLTLNYASPEQLRGIPVSRASDIFSLGVVCYHTLTGSRPYDLEGRPYDEALAIVLKTPMPLASRSPERDDRPYPSTALQGDIEDVLLRAMSIDPTHRPATARQLQEEFERQATAVETGVTGRRRTPWRLVAAGAIVAIAGAAGLWMMQVQSDRRAGRATPPAAAASALPSLESVPMDTLNQQAASVMNDANTELNAGRSPNAITPATELVRIRREQLRRATRSDDSGRLAFALALLSRVYLAAGQPVDGAAPASEAVAIWESMETHGPSFEVNYAGALATVGVIKTLLGQSDEGCGYLRKAEAALAAARPDLDDATKDRAQILRTSLPQKLKDCPR